MCYNSILAKKCPILALKMKFVAPNFYGGAISKSYCVTGLESLVRHFPFSPIPSIH